ncbi:Uncharacterised protein [Mycobacteroides abscessus subsp. abscessus]|nr:Uncharacterised protein [Mycobacteroides abscessus subsp. abscessus]
MSCQFFKLFIRIFRTDKLHKLHLIELMLADQTPCIAARRPRFRTEASTECGIIDRKLFIRQDFISVHVCNRHFCCRNQEVVFTFDQEGIFFELWQLPSACHAGTVDHICEDQA